MRGKREPLQAFEMVECELSHYSGLLPLQQSDSLKMEEDFPYSVWDNVGAGMNLFSSHHLRTATSRAPHLEVNAEQPGKFGLGRTSRQRMEHHARGTVLSSSR